MIGIGLLGKGTLRAAEAVGSGSRGLEMPWLTWSLAASGTGTGPGLLG